MPLKANKIIPLNKRIVKNLLVSAMLTIIIALGILSCFFRIDRMDGYGMFPTIGNNDRLLIATKTDIKRFDVVLLKRGNTYSIRRIIGLPGESISYQSDYCLINNEEVTEYFIIDSINKAAEFDVTYTEDFSLDQIIDKDTLPKGDYFVLGDNRQHTTDSRYYGVVRYDQIVGVVKYDFTTGTYY